MQAGYILQMDEVDAMQPEVSFILQQTLEPGGRLLLTLDARCRLKIGGPGAC